MSAAKIALNENKLAINAKVPPPNIKVMADAAKAKTHNARRRDRGGTARSRTRTNKSPFLRVIASYKPFGTVFMRVTIWPCSQRLRWTPAAVADVGKLLMTFAAGQNSGACPS